MSRRPMNLFVTAMATAVLIAACGGSATPTPAPTLAPATVAPATAAPVTTAAPETLAPATTAPSAAAETVPPATGALPTLPVESLPPIPSFSIPPIPSFSFTPDTTLEAMFPKTIQGQPVKVQSLHASDIELSLGSNPEQKALTEAFLASLGKTINDVSIAIGQVTLESGPETITATRVAGADANALLQGAIQLTVQEQTNSADYATATANVGGKNVTTITNTKDFDRRRGVLLLARGYGLRGQHERPGRRGDAARLAALKGLDRPWMGPRRTRLAEGVSLGLIDRTGHPLGQPGAPHGRTWRPPRRHRPRSSLLMSTHGCRRGCRGPRPSAPPASA